MNNQGLLDLMIATLPGLNPIDKINLLKTFDCENDFVIQSKRNIEEILNKELKKFWDVNVIQAKAEKITSLCLARSINWVSWNDMLAYPPLLREIYDPPPVIFYRGSLPNPEKPLLGMVGTRRPSPEAASQSYSIAYGAGQAGISVVSGLAHGIDTMSHRGNLAGNVPGYAVLGSGTDEVYPSANRALARKILESGGALISEYPPGIRPSKWTFPARNRIISALSRSVIVAEAPKKSGALITAAFALEHGRDLWVASTGVQESRPLYDRRGTSKLAADGAEIIYSSSDVLEKWNIKIEDENKMAEHKTTRMELVSSMADYLEIKL